MKVELVYSAEQWAKIWDIANANSISVADVFARRLKPPCDEYNHIKVIDEAACVKTPPHKNGGKKK